MEKSNQYISQLKYHDIIDLVYSILPEENEHTSRVECVQMGIMNVVGLDITLYRKKNDGDDDKILQITFNGNYSFSGLDYDLKRRCNTNKMPITPEQFKHDILKFMIKKFGKEYAYGYLAERSKLIETTCQKAQEATREFYSQTDGDIPSEDQDKDMNIMVRMEADKETAIENIRNTIETIIAEIALEDGANV